MAKFKGAKLGGGKEPSLRQAKDVHAVEPADVAPDVGSKSMIASGQLAMAGVKVVEMSADYKALLEMAYAPFKVEIVDIDIVLIFADGSKIIIPGMALATFAGHKPMLVFTDQQIAAELAVSGVGEIREQSLPVQLALSSASSTKDTPAKIDDGEKDASAAAGIQPKDSAATQQAAAAAEENRHKSDETSSQLTQKISSPPSSSAPAGVTSPRAAEVTPDDAIGPAGIGKLVPKLSFTLYNKEGVATSTENGGTVVKGSTGATGSSTSAAYSAQSQRETINGTSASETIYADNPAQAPGGTSLRVLTVEAMVPAKGLSLLQFTIPSLPAGYSVANAVKTDRGWVVDIDAGNIKASTTYTDATGAVVPVPANQSHFTFDIQLIYSLPAQGAPVASSGFQDEFFLPVQLGLSTDGKSSSNSVEVSTHFGIKVVANAQDMIVKDPVSGDPIYVLFSNPPGNIITAGDGNDRVIAGAGEDQIDGGSGTDIVSYVASNAAQTARSWPRARGTSGRPVQCAVWPPADGLRRSPCS